LSADPYNTGFKLDSTELPSNMDAEYEMGNMGHRPRTKGGYFPVNPPIDSGQDMRGEMLAAMASMGVTVEKHHHEVAPAQHELGIKFETLTVMADHLQMYKYAIHNVAHQYGKTATFMPKPVFGDNGSGMHVHQSIWKDGKPLFAGNQYADLSETCLYYIGGIIKHAKALNAFTNPSTNSYKRLVPGYEAPVCWPIRRATARLRAVFRGASPKGKRVEVRFPDPTANPYLAFSAMVMAGMDGIMNKIHPGDPMDKDLYDLPPEELKDIPTVCGSLREALAPGCRPRVPEGWRRVRRRPDRCLHRAEDGREHALRNDPAPGRVRHVLQILIAKTDQSTRNTGGRRGRHRKVPALTVSGLSSSRHPLSP
jgi:glutamine synthetase